MAILGDTKMRTKGELKYFLLNRLGLRERTANVLTRYAEEWIELPCSIEEAITALGKIEDGKPVIRSIHNMGVTSTNEVLKAIESYNGYGY